MMSKDEALLKNMETKDSLKNGRILVVDDEESIRTMLSYILEEEGLIVDTVHNGIKALEKIKYVEYHVAILDYKLPDTNGVDLAREIKRENKNIEVIILTGRATIESAIKAVKENVFDYLLKPVKPENLIKVIEGALEKQHLIKKNQELIWELRKKNKELERLNAFKGNLISMISHDLRSPISSLKGFNESFLQGFLGEITPQQRDIIETENRVIETMMELINSLLDMQQLESGNLIMKKKQCCIVKDVIEPVIERISVLAKEKKIKLSTDFEKDIPKVLADPPKMAQVVQNILQNALKFTPEGGSVKVKAQKNDDGNIEVSVRDSGKGIPSNELNTIFEAFYSMDNTKSNLPGRGLGLAICREIIKAHDGMIWAESAGEGKGSRFIFVVSGDVKGKTRVSQEPESS